MTARWHCAKRRTELILRFSGTRTPSGSVGTFPASSHVKASIPLKPRTESGMQMGLLSGGILFAQLQLKRDRFDPPDVRCGLAPGMLEV